MSKFLKPKVLITSALVLAVLVISILGGGLGEVLGLGFLAGPIPFFSVAAETVFRIGSFPVTNSMLLLWGTGLVVAVLAFLLSRQMKEVPGGLQNLIETILDLFNNIADNIGPKARTVLLVAFPIFLLVLLSNWFGLLPIVGSIGRVENVEEWLEHRVEHELELLEEDPMLAGLDHEALEILAHVEAIRLNEDRQFTVFDGDGFAIIPLGRGQNSLAQLSDVLVYDDHILESIEAEVLATGHLDGQELDDWHAIENSLHDSVVTSPITNDDGETIDFTGKTAGILIPYLRGPSTDLNFTLALAIIAVGTIQIFGVRSVGLQVYLRKFFTFRRGPIWTFVGILELLSEFARLGSFTVRLFGNIFAGEVLIFVIAFLFPLVGIIPFLGLEIFVGVVQAFIFAMLTLVFSYIASQAHGDEH